jgi:hypothetical protein
MYIYLGIGKGISVLGGLAVIGIVSFAYMATIDLKPDLRLDRHVRTLALWCKLKGEVKVRGMM